MKPKEFITCIKCNGTGKLKDDKVCIHCLGFGYTKLNQDIVTTDG